MTHPQIFDRSEYAPAQAGPFFFSLVVLLAAAVFALALIVSGVARAPQAAFPPPSDFELQFIGP